MREKASLALSYRRKQLPASLMQRLELMQHYALQATAQAVGRPQRQGLRAVRRGAHVIVLAWFSLGVLSSGAIGVGAVLGLRALAAGEAPMAWAAWAKAPASNAHDEQWDVVQVAIDRTGGRAQVLPLQVTGGDSFEIAIRGLPAGVRPSRGELRGESTWVLGRADLDGLHLMLDDAAPDTFDLKISVLASPGVTIVGSIVQVRRLEAVAQTQAASGADAPVYPGDHGMSAGPATETLEPAPAHPAPAVRTAAPRGDDKVGPVQRRAAPTAADVAGPPRRPAPARSWPEGASALGAVPREGEQPSWWQMPPPSWSPFEVGQERP